jgi:hypothetical protein
MVLQLIATTYGGIIIDKGKLQPQHPVKKIILVPDSFPSILGKESK